MPESTAATFAFADIAGFTALTEAHGDEEAVALIGEFCAAVDAELPAVDGVRVKTIGDAVMLRIPDPADAVRIGLRIAGGLLREHGAPSVRVGLHHGPAVEREGDYFGASINLAARVSSVAAGGEVLLTGETAARLALCGGIAIYLLGNVAFRLRMVGAVGYAKLAGTVGLLVLFALGGGLSALGVTALATVALGTLCVLETFQAA